VQDGRADKRVATACERTIGTAGQAKPGVDGMGITTWRSALLIGLATLGVPSATFADPAAQSTTMQAQTNGREVATTVRKLLNAHYVLPELRPRFDAVLARGLAEGRYDVSDRDRLVGLINADLQQVTPDRHLGVAFDPEQSRRLTLAPPGAGADDAPPTSEEIRQAIQINHGIAELKVFPGNVRYLRYDGFVWAGPKTAEALDTAMRFLRDGQAAIVDLRGNGGGSPRAVQYLVSHFLDPDRPIVTFYMRGEPAERLSTLASVPAGRMVGKPLYVLIGGMTASAAEEFAGHVAGFGIGELIGETTAGAGFRNEYYALPQGLVISISVGRAVLASTGKDWEAVGIAPTTRIAPERALDVAKANAWRKLAVSASGDEKRRLEAHAVVLDAQQNPVKTALPLAAYAGTYGERSLSVSGSGLVWQRKGGPKLSLVAIDQNEFAFVDDPMTRVSFDVASNDVMGLRMRRGDGSIVDAKRTP
jgi:C-terminal processing protease CtpA/Prc